MTECRHDSPFSEDKMKLNLILAPLAGAVFLGLSTQAYAISAGCAAVNGLSAASAQYGPYYSLTNSPLDEGDVVTISGDSANATWEFSNGPAQDSIPSSPKYGISAGAFSYSFTVPAGGLPKLGIFDTNYTGPGTMRNLSLTCLGTTSGSPPVAGSIQADPQKAMEYVGSVLALETATIHSQKIGSVVRNRLAKPGSRSASQGTGSDSSVGATALQYAPAVTSGFALNAAASAVNAIANRALQEVSSDRFSVWSSIGFSRIEQSVTGGSFDGNILDFSVGGDYKFSDDFLAGASVLGSRSKLDLDFNDGSLRATEIGIAPYIGYNIANDLIFDASFGYSKLDYDLKRNAGAISGDIDARRLFVSAGLSGEAALGSVTFTPAIRTIYAREWQDSYVDSSGLSVGKNDFDLGKLTLSTEFSYDLEMGELPITTFIRMDGNWMYERPGSVVLATGDIYRADVLSADVTLGITTRQNGINASLEVSRTGLFGADFTSFGVKGTLSASF